MNEACIESNRVIVVDTSCLLETENILELDGLGERAMNIRQIGCRKREASVVSIDVGVLEEPISLSDGGNIGTSEDLYQAILMGTIASLDPALGLGGIGKDQLDAE